VRFNRALAVLAITVILSVLAVAVLPTPALAAPTISLSPTSGTVGTQVEITGEKFESYAGDTIHIFFGNTEIDGSPLNIPGNGEFQLSFLIPDSAMPGRTYVTVRDENGNQLGESAEFVVPEPTILLDRGGGVVGTTVTISGTGFLASQEVVFIYTDHTTIELGSVTATPTGECTHVFTVPESTGKAHKVIGTDEAGNTAEAIFNVIPSVVLDPVAGAIGDTINVTGSGFGYKSRVTIDFDREMVTTTTSDSDGNIDTSLEVPDMPLETYEVDLTDLEGNTVTVMFTINAGEASFIFPEWGIYALIGIGALGLFILGIWIGRKYAYSY
jgi:hypothetical protein